MNAVARAGLTFHPSDSISIDTSADHGLSTNSRKDISVRQVELHVCGDDDRSSLKRRNGADGQCWPGSRQTFFEDSVTIAGQPCERLHIREHEIIKWERGGTRSIMVGAADNPDVTKVARALISAAS